MKIIHTADWHLGNHFHGHDRLSEHAHFLAWLLDTLRQRQPDALLISGDVFDTPNPPAAAEALLYDFLTKAVEAVHGLQVVMIAGNHDSAGRLEAPAPLLHRHNVYVRGAVRTTEKGVPDFDHLLLPLSTRTQPEAVCVCMAVPYLRSGDYPAGMTTEEGTAWFFDRLHKALARTDFKQLPTVVAAHFYAAGACVCEGEHSERLTVGGQDCVPAAALGRGVAYAALGHLHRAQKVLGGPCTWYAGSALPMSFSERDYRHGVQWVNITPEGKAEVESLEYHPQRGLLTIPADGGAASVAQVFDALANLPRREKNDDGATWPYLEVRVKEEQPEPTLMHNVMEALADRAVHLCRVVRVRTANEQDNAARDVLQESGKPSLSPLQMARRAFQNRYGSDMPEALVQRFKTAAQASEKEEEAQ